MPLSSLNPFRMNTRSRLILPVDLRRSLLCLLGFLACLLPTALRAQQQFQGVCASVKIEILQELATERIGFEATLEVTNNDGADPITDFYAELVFIDPEGGAEEEGEVVNDLFWVRQPDLRDVNRVDGSGVIGPTKKAVAKWFIVPKLGAGGTDPNGKEYQVSCNLGGKLAGIEIPDEVMFALPDTITVRPQQELQITYFQPRDVQGDDPFTEEVESPIPFTLGVLVKNSGFGVARDVTIESEQPRIVENEAGLLIVARLLGARVQDSPLDEASLTVDLGDIQPGQTKKGAWDMITSLSGEFIEFKASYTHAEEFGGRETSLIKSVEAHFIADEVINDEPGRDSILDFLADTDRDENRYPDSLFESEGPVLPVNLIEESEIVSPLENQTFELEVVSNFEGWGYLRIDDPGQAKYGFARVVRSDGKAINLENVWTNIRYRPSDNKKLTFFNLFDRFEPGTVTYTVEYAPVPDDTVPPETRVRFSGEVTQVGEVYYLTPGTEIFFTAEDQNAVSIQYRLGVTGDYRPALPFTLDAPGVQELFFFATDAVGNEETPRKVEVALVGGGPGLTSPELPSASLVSIGEAVSVRPDAVEVRAQVAPSSVALTGEARVYAGVRAFPQLAGYPVSPTPSGNALIEVFGQHTDFYRYRVNGGAWSPEAPASEAIELSGLSGTISLEVMARPAEGAFPGASEALSVTWVVDESAPDLILVDAPPSPSLEPTGAFSVEGSGFSLYRWSYDNSFFRPEEAPGTSFETPTLEPGVHQALFRTKVGDEWQTAEEASVYTWSIDPAYGSDFGGLPQVYTEPLTPVPGTTLGFVWDGRDNSGVSRTPGYYTIVIEIDDGLGSKSFASYIVEVDEVAGERAEIAAALEGARNTHSRGSWAVWQVQDMGAARVEARDFSAEVPATIDLSIGSLDNQAPATDGRYAAWEVLKENGATDIYYALLSGGAASASAVTNTSGIDERRPVIDFPWIVWEQRAAGDSEGPWQLHAYNMISGTVSPVDPTTQDQLSPSIHAGRVVWQDFRDVGFGEIYLANLETGQVERITDDTGGQYGPVIRNQYIVWQDNSAGQVELHAMDLLGRRSLRLTDTAYNETNPYLAGDWVLFEEDSLGTETANLTLYDLTTGKVLPLTRDTHANQSVGIAGDYLVWSQRESIAAAPSQALASRLPALQALIGGQQAMPVTTDLAARYPTAFALLEGWGGRLGLTSVERFTQLVPDVISEAASASGSGPTGTDFPLSAGSFVWLTFADPAMLDLGTGSSDPVILSAGVNAVSYDSFPADFTAYGLVHSIGAAKVRGVRLLDVETGHWKAVEVDEGEITGPNFRVPRAAVLLLEMNEAVASWKPSLP